jgi:hypothetical protein
MSTFNIINAKNYIQLDDTSVPSNPLAGQGRLYKKTGNADIFWKPDAAGSEVNLTSSFDQQLNSTDDVEFNNQTLTGDLTIYNPIDNNNYTIGNGNYISQRAGNQYSGPVQWSDKARGTILSPTTVLSGDNIGTHYMRAHNGSEYVLSAYTNSQATENFSVGAHGTKYEISTCDNGSTTPISKIACDTDGVTINNQYYLPKTQGTSGQVITSDGAGASSWVDAASANPFDQPLNTTDGVNFNSVTLDNKWTFENLSNNILNVKSTSNGMSFDFGGNEAKYFGLTHSANPDGFILTTETSRGTSYNNRLATESGDPILTFKHSGQGASTTVVGSSIVSTATQNFNNYAAGTSITISTCANNSTVLTPRIKLSENGVNINDGADSFTLPTTKGTSNQVMTSDGAGASSWVDNTNSFDQPLNTTDGVNFNSVTLDNKWIFENLSNNHLNVETTGNGMFFDFGDNEAKYFGLTHSANPDGFILTTETSRGTSFNSRLATDSGDNILTFKHSGQGTSAPVVGSSIVSTATQDFTNSAAGTSMTISTCANNSTVLTPRIKLSDNGVNINDGADSFTLPTTKGTSNQVMTSDGAGVSSWVDTANPFDQGLNKTDEVEFLKLNILNDPTSLTSYNYLTGGAFTYNRMASNGVGGLGVVNYRAKGTLQTPLAIISGNHISETYYNGYDGNGYSNGAIVYMEASENWTPTANGTKYKIDMVDNGSTTKTTKLIIDTDGVNILDQYYLPTTQGVAGQVITSDGTGVSSWAAPFIPYHYNYQTYQLSQTIYPTPVPTIVKSPSTEQTKIVIQESGKYTVNTVLEAELGGSLPQLLTARVLRTITYLENLSYINHPTADFGGQTLTAGNYHHAVGAATLTGTLTLQGSATDIWVFRISNGAFTANDVSRIVLEGALAQNVFWVVTGAFTVGNAYFSGITFGKAAMSLNMSAEFTGSMFGVTGLMSFGPSAYIIPVPNNSEIDMGVLGGYLIYNSSGNITRTGSAPPTNGEVLTGNGTISGFGPPYDGTYNSGTVQPFIWANFYLFKNGDKIQDAARCGKNGPSECNTIAILIDVDCNGGDTIDVRVELSLLETSCQVRGRTLNATRRYIALP